LGGVLNFTFALNAGVAKFGENLMSVIEDAFARAQEHAYSTSADLQCILDALCQAGATPGVVVEIRHGGKTISASCGTQSIITNRSMSPLTQLRVGCMTKVFTSLAIAQDALNGTLDLNDEVVRHLPQFRHSPSLRGVKIWHLMSHSSGIAGLDMWDPYILGKITWDDYASMLMNDRKIFEPGSVFNYDHAEHVVLGKIHETITGESPGQFQERVLGELGLPSRYDDSPDNPYRNQDHSLDSSQVAFKAIPDGEMSPFWDASLSRRLMTLHELATLGGAALDGFSSTSFSAASALLERQVVGIPKAYGSRNAEQTPLTFGLGWGGYSGGVFGHNGSSTGQTSGVRFDPATKTVVAVALNVWNPYIRDRLISVLLSSFQGRPIDATRRKAEMVGADEVPGRYVNGISGEEIHIAKDGGTLKARHIKNFACLREMTIRITPGCDLEIEEDLHHGSFGIFRDPTKLQPAIQFGMFAFSRAGDLPTADSGQGGGAALALA
jgi:CubicO group peptidase (beta-lactamase class C family)